MPDDEPEVGFHDGDLGDAFHSDLCGRWGFGEAGPYPADIAQPGYGFRRGGDFFSGEPVAFERIAVQIEVYRLAFFHQCHFFFGNKDINREITGHCKLAKRLARGEFLSGQAFDVFCENDAFHRGCDVQELLLPI